MEKNIGSSISKFIQKTVEGNKETPFKEEEITKKIAEKVMFTVKEGGYTEEYKNLLEKIKRIYNQGDAAIKDVTRISLVEEKIETEEEKVSYTLNKIKTFGIMVIEKNLYSLGFTEDNVENFLDAIEQNNIDEIFKNFKIITQGTYNEIIYKTFNDYKKIKNVLEQLKYINKHTEPMNQIDFETGKPISNSEREIYEKAPGIIEKLISLGKDPDLIGKLKLNIKRGYLGKAVENAKKLVRGKKTPYFEITNLENSKTNKDYAVELSGLLDAAYKL